MRNKMKMVCICERQLAGRRGFGVATEKTSGGWVAYLAPCGREQCVNVNRRFGELPAVATNTSKSPSPYCAAIRTPVIGSNGCASDSRGSSPGSVRPRHQEQAESMVCGQYPDPPTRFGWRAQTSNFPDFCTHGSGSPGMWSPAGRGHHRHRYRALAGLLPLTDVEDDPRTRPEASSCIAQDICCTPSSNQ